MDFLGSRYRTRRRFIVIDKVIEGIEQKESKSVDGKSERIKIVPNQRIIIPDGHSRYDLKTGYVIFRNSGKHEIPPEAKEMIFEDVRDNRPRGFYYGGPFYLDEKLNRLEY